MLASTNSNPGPPQIRWTAQTLNTFWNDHADWAQALPGAGPHYAIPAAAIRGPQLKRIFGDLLEVERKFTQVCDENRIVGVWGSHTVGYHHLTRPPLQLDPAWVSLLGWTAQQVAMIYTAGGQADVASERLQGVVGWLLTEPAFLKDLGNLRTEYEALPVPQRPIFPLGRVVTMGTPNDHKPKLSAATSAFVGKLRQLLDRWGLMQLATWDLPDPQGPLLPNLLPEGPARPAHGIHIFVPLHYPLHGDDDLLGRVREFQKQQAATLGLPPGFGGIAHHAQYSQMFRLIHLDEAVRGRFQGRPPRGIVSALEAAAHCYLGISEASIRRLWTWVRKCRNGDRQSIRELRG